jgi:hypothetical protein
MYGPVVRLRVRPRDVVSVSDVVQAVGMYREGMSLSQAVSIALAAALETLRQAHIIPDRSGVEYQDVLRRYRTTDKNSRRLAMSISKELEEMKMKIDISPIPLAVGDMRARFHELASRMPDLSEEEMKEFQELGLRLFPDPDLDHRPIGRDHRPIGRE